ncbi:MAG TPA: hypothetical protein VD794_17115, partial [Flavisolibacter sp.]|nr:hypothetical protein [Flavisolibacter sp.]
MFRKLFANKGLTSIYTTLLVFSMTACTSTKELEYFQDLPNSNVTKLAPMPKDQRVIESGDDINVVFIARD